jgi:hypothetical protein
MNPQEEKTSRASQHDMGWIPQRTKSLSPVDFQNLEKSGWHRPHHVSLVPMLRNFLPTAILLAMAVASFLGLLLGWTSRRKIESVASWRKITAYIGLSAVTLQALLFIALWTPLVRYRLLLLQSVNLEIVLLLIAVPCIFLGQLQRRWWLIASAAFLPFVSWFSVLAEVAY